MLELITAFGLGSIITVTFQSLINIHQNNKSLRFNEKKEAYIGLLEAYHKAAVYKDDKSAKEFAYWQIRCELISDKKVRSAIEKIIETNCNYDARDVAQENLKSVLRADLGISKKD